MREWMKKIQQGAKISISQLTGSILLEISKRNQQKRTLHLKQTEKWLYENAKAALKYFSKQSKG